MVKKIPDVSFPDPDSRPPGFFFNEDELRQLHSKYQWEDLERLFLLVKHYNIQPGPEIFIQLALELARELYPEPKKGGRQSKWTIHNKGALVVEIERLKRSDDPDHGVSWAAIQLANREPWKSFLESSKSGSSSPDPAGALRKAYYDFKDDRWAEISRKAYGYHTITNTIEDWENHVTDVVKKPPPN